MEYLELQRLKGILTLQQLTEHFDESKKEYFYRNGMPSTDLIEPFSEMDCLRYFNNILMGLDSPHYTNDTSILFLKKFIDLAVDLPSTTNELLKLIRSYEITFKTMWHYYRPSICIIIKDMILQHINKIEILDILELTMHHEKSFALGKLPIDKVLPEQKTSSNTLGDFFSWDNILLKLNENDANTVLTNQEVSHFILPFLFPSLAKAYSKCLASIHSNSSPKLSVVPSSFILKQITTIDEHVSESTAIIQLPTNDSPWKYFWLTFHYNMGCCVGNKSKDLPILLSNEEQHVLSVKNTQNKIRFNADQLAMVCARIFSSLIQFKLLDGDMKEVHNYLKNGHNLLKSFVLIGMAANSKTSGGDPHRKSLATAQILMSLNSDTTDIFLQIGHVIAKGILAMHSPKHVPINKVVNKSINLDYLQECCTLCSSMSSFSLDDLQDVDFTCHNGLNGQKDMLVVSAGIGFGIATMGNFEASHYLDKLVNTFKLALDNRKLHFSNKTGAYIALMLHYLQSNTPLEELNIFSSIETPDAFLKYKAVYSIEETLYRALLLSLNSTDTFENCVSLILFPFIPSMYIDYNLGNYELQSHYYALVTGVFLGKCIVKVGTQDTSLLNVFNKLKKCFIACTSIENTQIHYYCNLLISGIACVFSGSCMDSLASFIQERINLSFSFSDHIILQQSLGMLFLGNGNCTIRNSITGQAFVLLLLFPDYPLHIEDHSLIYPPLRYLWINALDDRRYETRDILNDEAISLLTETQTNFTTNSKLQMSPLLAHNSNGSQTVTINDDRYEPVSFELYRNDYSSLKSDHKQVKKGIVHVLPKEVYKLYKEIDKLVIEEPTKQLMNDYLTISPYLRDDFCVLKSNPLIALSDLSNFMWDVKLLKTYVINWETTIPASILYDLIRMLESKRNSENNDLGLQRIFIEYDT